MKSTCSSCLRAWKPLEIVENRRRAARNGRGACQDHEYRRFAIPNAFTLSGEDPEGGVSRRCWAMRGRGNRGRGRRGRDIGQAG